MPAAREEGTRRGPSAHVPRVPWLLWLSLSFVACTHQDCETISKALIAGLLITLAALIVIGVIALVLLLVSLIAMILNFVSPSRMTIGSAGAFAVVYTLAGVVGGGIILANADGDADVLLTGAAWIGGHLLHAGLLAGSAAFGVAKRARSEGARR